MVRYLAWIAGVLAVSAAVVSHAQAQAQSVDWRSAGGALFAMAEDREADGSATSVAPETVLDSPDRLTAPNQPFGTAIAVVAERHGLDPKLLHALVIVESAYRPGVCSSAGACGLTQLMPGTARDLGVADRFDPGQNLTGGAAYLTQQIVRFGDIRLALAAYNSGPGRVARLGRVPDIDETRAYVAAVVNCFLALTAGRDARSSRDCAAPATRP